MTFNMLESRMVLFYDVTKLTCVNSLWKRWKCRSQTSRAWRGIPVKLRWKLHRRWVTTQPLKISPVSRCFGWKLYVQHKLLVFPMILMQCNFEIPAATPHIRKRRMDRRSPEMATKRGSNAWRNVWRRNQCISRMILVVYCWKSWSLAKSIELYKMNIAYNFIYVCRMYVFVRNTISPTIPKQPQVAAKSVPMKNILRSLRFQLGSRVSSTWSYLIHRWKLGSFWARMPYQLSLSFNQHTQHT